MHWFEGLCKEPLDEIAARRIAHGIGFPAGAAQQVLEAIRSGLATDLGQLPAVFALGGTQQTSQ
jgi:hypothetical protein